jgi:hypothetical protein
MSLGDGRCFVEILPNYDIMILLMKTVQDNPTIGKITRQKKQFGKRFLKSAGLTNDGLLHILSHRNYSMCGEYLGTNLHGHGKGVEGHLRPQAAANRGYAFLRRVMRLRDFGGVPYHAADLIPRYAGFD